MWLRDPDGAAQFPNEDDIAVLVVGATRARLEEFRADRETAYTGMLERLPDGPDVSGAERVTKLVGKLELPNVIRPAVNLLTEGREGCQVPSQSGASKGRQS